jgi:very-short-patch-repair endonuclease
MNLYYEKFIKDIQHKYDALKKWKIDHPNVVGKVWNPFSRCDISVYTDVDEFESPYSFVTEYSYTELGEKYAKWIKDTQSRLLSEKTPSEKFFSSVMCQTNTRVLEQPYFKINENGYFLDFYLPEYGLAFELNGKVHKGQKNEEYDLNRDYAFHSIGIRTIRLSNRDINCEDLKAKINIWANESLNGNFDPSLYYKRPNANKFDGKDTRFQDYHKKLNKILSRKNYSNKTVLIETDYTYFCLVLGDKRYDTSHLSNSELVSEYFDIIEKNSVRVYTQFVGNMNNMHNNKLNDWLAHNNQSVARRIDKVIRIVGDKIEENLDYESNDYNIFRFRIVKDKSGNDCFLSGLICLSGMYLPYHKFDARKHRFRKKPVYLGSSFCNLCEYCCGVDMKNGIVRCKGFLNKGTKNIYDHIVKNDFCSDEDLEVYNFMIDFRKKELYETMMKSIREQIRQKALRKMHNNNNELNK